MSTTLRRSQASSPRKLASAPPSEVAGQTADPTAAAGEAERQFMMLMLEWWSLSDREVASTRQALIDDLLRRLETRPASSSLLPRIRAVRQALATKDAANNVDKRRGRAGRTVGRNTGRHEAAAAQADTFDQARARGEAQLLAWTQDGTLIAAAALAQHWSITSQGLAADAQKGRLLLAKIRGRRWAPRGYLELSREDIAQVSRALDGVPSSSQLIFWVKPHGGLADRTPAQAMQAGDMDAVLRVAHSWAADQSPPSPSLA